MKKKNKFAKIDNQDYSVGENTLIKIVFPKEPTCIKFFESVKEADGNLVLKPYVEFNHEGKKVKSHQYLSLQVMDVANEEFEFTLGKFVNDILDKCEPKRWRKYFPKMP